MDEPRFLRSVICSVCEKRSIRAALAKWFAESFDRHGGLVGICGECWSKRPEAMA